MCLEEEILRLVLMVQIGSVQEGWWSGAGWWQPLWRCKQEDLEVESTQGRDGNQEARVVVRMHVEHPSDGDNKNNTAVKVDSWTKQSVTKTSTPIKHHLHCAAMITTIPHSSAKSSSPFSLQQWSKKTKWILGKPSFMTKLII